MESVKVKEFLSTNNSSGSAYGFASGSGYASGSGDAYGSGSGYASGSGAAYGSGSGYASGSGAADACASGFASSDDFGVGPGYGASYADGSGDSSGCGNSYDFGFGYGFGYGSACDIKSYINKPVCRIDDTPTIIQSIRGNVAKCLILKSDLTTRPCFVVKVGNCFAHGNTIKEALRDAQRKHFSTIGEEERLFEFVKSHKWGVEYPDKDFYEWHSNLTGSCAMGRDMFAKEHGLEKLDGKHTVEWFVDLTKDAYGGEIIKRIPGLYKNKQTGSAD